MAFTPKFVDLVRNSTATVGTGPIALGAAADGYKGFAQACAPGDQFYYCIQGIDRPTESEVGRGTMLPDGTIARDPISGTPTNFRSGVKTIALVAAAEWFDRAGGSIAVGTRAELAELGASDGQVATLDEEGREGRFRFDAANLSAKVAADTAQGLYVAPAAQPSGASGAWCRMVEGAVDPRWFGLQAGAGQANANSAAMTAMFAALKSRAHNQEGMARGLEPVQMPAGEYHFAQTIDLDGGTILLEGGGGAKCDGALTRLVFPVGVTGIRVQADTTSGATATVASKIGANGSIIRGLQLRGGFAATEGNGHGIHLRGAARIERVTIADFDGQGILVQASAGGSDGGNANGFSIDSCRIIRCQNGLKVEGADANAGSVIALDVVANRQWGVWDSSFLGNSYVGCHAAANGWDGAIGSVPTACVQGGNRYYVKTGQAAGASTNAPSGTSADNQWWGYIGPGGTYSGVVAWVNGTAFREGGAYHSDDANARNLFVGCYSEGDQNPSQFAPTSLLVGGLHGAGTANFSGHLETSLGQLRSKGNFAVDGMLAANNPNNTFGPSTGAAADTYAYIDNTNFYSNISFRSWLAGAPSNDGVLKSWRGNGLVLTSKAVTHIGVDFVAGTFEVRSSGAVLTIPGAGLGYGVGAGGSVTQATSKSTGVTLDRACGKIVTHGAALAANTAVSFTLTNASIAATDTVIATAASGATAGAYQVQADAVAAGSCRISIRNLTGGSLAETIGINFAVIKAAAA